MGYSLVCGRSMNHTWSNCHTLSRDQRDRLAWVAIPWWAGTWGARISLSLVDREAWSEGLVFGV